MYTLSDTTLTPKLRFFFTNINPLKFITTISYYQYQVDFRSPYNRREESTNLKIHGYLQLSCCKITKQVAMMRLGDMLKIYFVFGRSEPSYAYKLNAYIKENMQFNQIHSHSHLIHNSGRSHSPMPKSPSLI